MISVAPEVPPVSVHQCQLSVLNSATCQCLPVHISATYQCPSELPFSVTHQCHLSVPPITSASALMISVAPAVPPVSVHQCQLSVLISATCQCP
ncbi:unnamed protein product [Staurois parvus]|uniref:Uncharacterized protein n=1 Tax=Staurois parvus TaxID=386267 RepID=A0ABN9B6W1_9NEOB|nr:unnamed protein product [Staurois parvus]